MFWAQLTVPSNTAALALHGAVLGTFQDGVCQHCEQGRLDLRALADVSLGSRCRALLSSILAAKDGQVQVTSPWQTESDNESNAAAVRRLMRAQLVYRRQWFGADGRYRQHALLTPLGRGVAEYLAQKPAGTRIRWQRAADVIANGLLLPPEKLLQRAVTRLGGDFELANAADRPMRRALRDAARAALGRIAPDLLVACGPASDVSLRDVITAAAAGADSLCPSSPSRSVPVEAAETIDLGLF